VAREILTGNVVREKLYHGVKHLSDIVSSTLGPRGQNVVIDRAYGTPLITKDGVTVAKEVFLADPFQAMGCEAAKEAAARLSNDAGDGTTTTLILVEALMRRAKTLLDDGYAPILLQREMTAQVKLCREFIKKSARDVTTKDDVFRIASISANNDPVIGDLIRDAYKATGHATILVTESKSTETKIKTTSGLELNRGWLAPHFVTDPKSMIWEAENVRVLIYDGKIAALKPLMPLLQHCSTNSIPLLIVANEVEGEALATLVVNALKGTIKICAVRAPLFGDKRELITEDLAIVTGGQVISPRTGSDLETLEEPGKLENFLGRATSVRVTRDNATFSGGGCDKDTLDTRISQVKSMLTECGRENEEFHRIRLAKLEGGISELEIGGDTDTEMTQRKARADDAVCATRAALEEGIVPGGGALYAFMSFYPELQAPGAGAKAVREALRAPMSKLLQLSGIRNPGKMMKKLYTWSYADSIQGYDVLGDQEGNMINMGIIDPAKVTRIALESALSVASLLLTSSAIIVPERQKDPLDDHRYNARG